MKKGIFSFLFLAGCALLPFGTQMSASEVASTTSQITDSKELAWWWNSCNRCCYRNCNRCCDRGCGYNGYYGYNRCNSCGDYGSSYGYGGYGYGYGYRSGYFR